ncbi:hypothetical protein [Paenibacillus hamazuiensis]|uniref:hypothetical protein n=1 Tax=Paenibacillus hamazuiensis TaxID=2936508 RepID=UPI00200BB5DC|nr:hypothetical protein [Paenibacillus hamazuiensis]
MVDKRTDWRQGEVLFLIDGRRYWVVRHTAGLCLVDMSTAETIELQEEDQVTLVLPADKVRICCEHTDDELYL